MGVPKFFRYTSERYPCLNELVKPYQIPDFDNMYLDMNGIIHNCSHPDDSNPHFRITEEQIFKDIFHYLSILFQIIKPKKLFFMAIDGVAPRAKMNQQRGRRFRSAKDAEKLEQQAREKGEVLPQTDRFDSNCITPGTPFMSRLHEQLKYFVKDKITNDPMWAKVKVVLSGHETPGEGEHKIMDYIRWARSQPDYNPNTRHCLYGLDADLIMLGMCTHEPHFALLREEVKFGKSTQRATSPEDTNFYLLQLSLLREYLEQDFLEIKDKLSFRYDIENIVDDWVLMGFLVGNDFIPNLPNMHINNGALPLLYKTYMKVLPTLDGYINESGDLHLGRFEAFMTELAKIDKEKFQETYADVRYFEAKTGRRPNANERREYVPNNDDTFNVNIEEIKANKPDDELQALINATYDMLLDDNDLVVDLDNDDGFAYTSDEEANFNMEFRLHKSDYYINKMDYADVTEEVLVAQAQGYVRAIQWNLLYYYKGCPSWSWYYPHHYAPYISDIKGFSNLNIEFELGEPFKPFEQLLGVLPAASKQLLPEPFHHLMTSEDSPIYSYYPVDFETDLNGKQRDWEAVVLIPFIDEKKLLAAMAPCYSKLTPEEKRRNQHGPMLIYNRSAESQGPVIAPEYFPSIRECHATETRVWREQLIVPPGQLVHGMLPTVNRDMMYPGFPTTRHLKYETYIKKCKVKVFDQPSFNENMIMKILPEIETNPPLEQVANEYLGKIIWVGWPHLTRAKVISVSNEMRRLHLLDTPRGQQRPEYMTEINEGNLRNQWVAERQTIVEHNMRRLGIEVGSVHVIIHAINLRGYKYLIEDNLELTLEPEWCVIPCGYALQAVVKEINTYVLDLPTRYTNVEQAFPPGDNVFLTTPGPYYGSNAKIVECSLSGRNRRVKVCVCEHSEPLPRMVPAVRYSPANHAAATAGITPQVLSRLTGCVLVITGGRPTFNQPIESMSKLNLGLNLKFNKKNQEVSGYTRRTYTNMWTYSERCVRLIIDYVHNFPEMISNLGRMVDRDVFFEEELWPGEVGKGKPQEVQQWLNKQSHTKAAKRECGSEALEAEECRMLADDIDNQIAVLKTQMKKLTLQVKLNLLYKPELHEGNIPPDPKADYKIYDRVICTANNITVPIGARGTVTAVHRPSTVNNVRLSDIINSECTYQVMFDNPFPGAMHEEFFDTPRFYRMSSHNLLNISYGRKIRNPVCTGPSVAFIPLIPAPVPNILRREDGHNSAFASYSPTRERQAQNEANNMNMPPPPPQPETSTEFLKNLLKISENDGNNPDAWRIKHEMNNQQNLRPQPGNWSDGCNPPITGNRPLEEECYQNMPQAMPVPPYPLFDHPDQMQAVITETPYVQVVPTYTVGLLINQPPMPGPPHSLLGPPPNHGQYLGNNQNNQTYSQVPMHNQYISTPAYTQGNVRPAQVPPYQYQPPPFNNGQYPTPLPQPDAYNVPMNNRINQTPQTNQVQKPNNQRPNQGRWTSLGHRVNQQINQAQKLNQHMHMGQQVNMGQQMQPNMGQQMHPGRQMNMGQQMTQGPRMHPGQQMKMSQQMTQGPQMHPGQQMKMSQQMTQGSQMHPGQQMNMGQQMNRGQMHPGQQINNTINPMDVNLNRPKDLGLPVNQTPGVNHSLIPNANQVPLPNFQINQDVKHKERKVSTDASFPKTPQVSVNNVPANMPVEQTNTTNAGQNKTADTSAKNAKPATSATTPFVPLQVQASRRRSETSEFRALGSIQKKMTAPETKPAAAEIKVASMEIRPTAPIPKPAPPPTEWIKQQSESANNNAATSPKDSNKNNSEKEKNKKRKSRLAIDLPFKTE